MPALPTIRTSLTALAIVATMTGMAHAEQIKAPCGVPGLKTCPQPFDKTLPAAKDMLSWDQATRVVGFRNTYRL